MEAVEPLVIRFVPPGRGEAGPALVPVVVVDHVTGEVRMVAFASPEAVDATLATRKATFYSRSRKAVWVKGETSGHTLDVHAVLLDCDEDALVYRVTPQGPTCHTGAPSCFFREVAAAAGGLVTAGEAPPATALARLDAVLEARRASTAAKSYAKSLFDAGPARVGEKLREEADELARAVAGETDERVISEAADVLFHTMVALRSRGLGVETVLRELERRSGTSGHAEKAARDA